MRTREKHTESPFESFEDFSSITCKVQCVTFFHSCNDGGEVVVQQDHVGGLLGDVRPGDTHGNTDVGLLQGRRVVHTVTCHGHDGSLKTET